MTRLGEGLVARVRRGTERGLLVVAVFLAVAIPALAAAPTAAAQAARGTDTGDTRHAVRLAGPAVVRIVTEIAGRVVCHGCAQGQDLTFPADAANYLEATSGSGAFISPDGYIMTADHVVDFSDTASLELDFVDAAAQDYAQQSGTSASAAQTQFEQFWQQGTITASVRVGTPTVFLSTDYTGQLADAGRVVSFPLVRIAANSPIDEQDTAIIKVDAQDMPFLQLAAASEVHVQDTATAVAYPGDADPTSANEDNNFDLLLHTNRASTTVLNNLLTPTVETGSIIAQKTVAANTAAYETTGIANHGSSGGAVINSDGKIVGFVDRFSSTDSDRVTILVASSVVSQYAVQTGVPAAPRGAFMTLWTKAIGEYDATGPCHFTNAARDLQRLEGQYAQFGGATQFQQDAQSKATAAECPPTPQGVGRGALFGALGGFFLVAFVVVLVLTLRRNRRQPEPALVGVPVGAYGYGMPAAPSVPLMAPPGTGYPLPGGPGMGYPGQGGQASYGPQSGQRPPWPYGAPPQSQYGAVLPQTGYGSAAPATAPQSQQFAPPPGQTGAQYPAFGQPPYGQPPSAFQSPPAYPPLPDYPTGMPSSPSQANAPVAGGGQYCANGHLVQEPNSQFCPFCGAPVQPPRQ